MVFLLSIFLLTMSESDDDSPDNTHTQRVLAQFYLSAEGVLPSWLPPPSSLPALTATSSSSHHPPNSNASSGSGNSAYRAGGKPGSLQDIYDSAGPNQSSLSRTGRNQDYASEQGPLGRQPLAGDRLRNKLRPPNSRPSPRPGSYGDQEPTEVSGSAYSRGAAPRSGFGGDEYDPYNYQQGGYDSNRQGQYGGLPSRPGGRK